MKIALIVAYDGTDYGGWQIQKNKITVQEKLEAALFAVTGERGSVCASGRTDSGVHAAGQVCHFTTNSNIPPEKFAGALNAGLPADIRVLRSLSVPEEFDSNRQAKRKTYCYRAYLSEHGNPLKDRYSVWVKGRMDLAKLQHIAGVFVGEHDFKAYCKSGSQVKTTVREVYSVEVKTHKGRYCTDIEIYICGGGFLYNMVRTMAGTMFYYAQGVLSEEQVLRSLSEGNREFAGKTMPPRGLTLESVEYGGLYGI